MQVPRKTASTGAAKPDVRGRSAASLGPQHRINEQEQRKRSCGGACPLLQEMRYPRAVTPVGGITINPLCP